MKGLLRKAPFFRAGRAVNCPQLKQAGLRRQLGQCLLAIDTPTAAKKIAVMASKTNASSVAFCRSRYIGIRKTKNISGIFLTVLWDHVN